MVHFAVDPNVKGLRALWALALNYVAPYVRAQPLHK